MPKTDGSVGLHEWAAGAARLQGGAITRAQLLGGGCSPAQIRAQLAAKRWSSPYPGVFLTTTGAPARDAQLWAALLACGTDAALCLETAAEAWGFGPRSDVVHVLVPAERRVSDRTGIAVVRSRHASARTDRRAIPPRTTVENTVLDLVERSTSELDAVGWITRAAQQRRTTPKRIFAASLLRPALTRRGLVLATCAHVADGAQSPLEVGWIDRVERPHGLPRATRQAVGRVGGRRVFRDLAYEAYGLYIELDGRVGHVDADGRFRDLNRDNAAVVEGRVTLRYGWAAVFGTACEAASQVAGLLVARGWRGAATPCGGCSG